MPPNPEGLPQNPEGLPQHPEGLPPNPEPLRPNPEGLPQNPEALPQVPRALPIIPRVLRGKNMVLLGDGFQIGHYGIPRDPNGLYGTQEAFGKASFPQNPFKKWFPSTFPNFGKFGEGPPGSPVDLLSSLCGSYRGWWHGRRPVV